MTVAMLPFPADTQAQYPYEASWHHGGALTARQLLTSNKDWLSYQYKQGLDWAGLSRMDLL